MTPDAKLDDPLKIALDQDVGNLCMELRLQKIPVEDAELRNRAADMLRFLYDRVSALAATSANLRVELAKQATHSSSTPQDDPVREAREAIARFEAHPITILRSCYLVELCQKLIDRIMEQDKKIEQLRHISNVNGDWSMKHSNALAEIDALRAQLAEREGEK